MNGCLCRKLAALAVLFASSVLWGGNHPPLMITIVYGYQGEFYSATHTLTPFPKKTTTASPFYPDDSNCYGWDCHTSTSTTNFDDYYDSLTSTSTSAPSYCYGRNCITSTSTLGPYSDDEYSWTDQNYSGTSSFYRWYDGDDSTSATTTTTTTTVEITYNSKPNAVYPTNVLHKTEPSKDEHMKCKVFIPVRKLSEGKRSALLRGSVKVTVTTYGTKVLIIGESEDQRPPVSWFRLGSKLRRHISSAIFGSQEYYTYSFTVPQGCHYSPYDSGVYAEALYAGEDVIAVNIQLKPDVIATYAPSSSPRPTAPAVYYFGKNGFKQFSFCLFGMEITRQIIPESLILTASAHSAKVMARDLRTGDYFDTDTVYFPFGCRPGRLDLVSWWVTQGPSGGPLVLLYVGDDGFSRGDPTYEVPVKKVSVEGLLAP